MKKFFLISLFIGLIIPTAYSDSCFPVLGSFFKKKPPFHNVSEFELLEKINNLEKVTSRLRNLKENPEPAINIKLSKKLASLDSYLLDGRFDVHHREWRTLFRTVELSFIIVKKNQKVLKILSGFKGTNPPAEVFKELLTKGGLDEGYASLMTELYQKQKTIKLFKEKIMEESKNRLVVLGNNYHEYKMVRGHLTDLLSDNACTPDCLKNVKLLLSKLGVSYDYENVRFAKIIGNIRTIPQEDLSVLVHKNPIAYLTRMKKERNAEIFMLVKNFLFQPYVIDRIFKGLFNFTGLNKTKLIRLLKFVYDEQARTLHFPKINKIIRSPKDVPEKFHLLKELNSTVDSDELMVNFSRRVDQQTSNTWKTLSNYAKENDPSFYSERMIPAEERGKVRGDISLVHEKSFVAKLASLLFVGGGLTYYYLDKGEFTELQEEGEMKPSEAETIEVPVDDEESESLIQDLRKFMEDNIGDLFSAAKKVQKGTPRQPASQK